MSVKTTRRDILKAAGAGVLGAGVSFGSRAEAQETAGQPVEWRNRQPGMAYRRLGRTGYMVSEIVQGGNTISPDNNDHVRLAIDMGLNFLDTAPAYGGGRSEMGYGALFKNNSSLRERVFINSKVSAFDIGRGNEYNRIFQSLSEDEKERIDREKEDVIERRAIRNTRYMGVYGRWQYDEIERAYLSNIMETYYGDRIDRRALYHDSIIKSVEESLARLNTDYLDLLMCPHGANSPEELLIPEIYEAMTKLKEQGKVRAFALSSHTDPANILFTAVNTGFYDAVMIAYNVANGDFTMPAVREAYEHDVGVIAMKAAKAVASGNNAPAPESRIAKLNHQIPEQMKTPVKAYLWALQNPNLACVNSDMANMDMVRDNLAVAGRKVDLVPLENLDG